MAQMSAHRKKLIKVNFRICIADWKATICIGKGFPAPLDQSAVLTPQLYKRYHVHVTCSAPSPSPYGSYSWVDCSRQRSLNCCTWHCAVISACWRLMTDVWKWPWLNPGLDYDPKRPIVEIYIIMYLFQRQSMSCCCLQINYKVIRCKHI